MNDITINELIKKHLEKVQKELSTGTLKHNKSHLLYFHNYCEKNNLIMTSQFNDDELDIYIDKMKETCTNRTINIRVGILKRAYRNNNIEFSYLQDYKKLKEVKRSFKTINDNNIKEIVKHVKTLNKESKLMYQGLILLLVDTGARINEVMHIEKRNISIAENEILLTTTKTKEERTVYFLDDTKEIINRILKLKTKSKYLLYNIEKGRQINYDDVRYFMRYLKETLNIDRLHPHMFRHTLATKLVDEDANLIMVQKLLGHTNISTTKLYVHMSKKKVKSTYQEKFKR